MHKNIWPSAKKDENIWGKTRKEKVKSALFGLNNSLKNNVGKFTCSMVGGPLYLHNAFNMPLGYAEILGSGLVTFTALKGIIKICDNNRMKWRF